MFCRKKCRLTLSSREDNVESEKKYIVVTTLEIFDCALCGKRIHVLHQPLNYKKGG